jgi:RNA polymerase sigma-70 factor (ECF subfamily)
LKADYKLPQPTQSAYLTKGNDSAFEAFFVAHHDRIYTVVFRLVGNQADAEDITQQAFMKLYRAFDQFDAQPEETNIAGWLYRVAVNQAYDTLRRQKRRHNWREKLGRLWPPNQSAPDPAGSIERQETQARVRQILAGMKPRDAKLLLLRHAGLSYKELAAALNVAPGSVGSLLTQAKRAFAKKYRRAFPQEGRDDGTR